MLSFITGVLIPLITKSIESLIKAKTKKVEIEANAQAQNNNNAVEIAKCNAQIAVAQAEVDKLAIQHRPKTTTSKWIKQSIDAVRLLFGLTAFCIFVMASLHYFYPTRFGSVLEYDDFSNAFFVILGFFFGERCVKKAFGH